MLIKESITYMVIVYSIDINKSSDNTKSSALTTSLKEILYAETINNTCFVYK